MKMKLILATVGKMVRDITQQTRDIDPMLVYCWANVYNIKTTLGERLVSAG